ncbi:ATP-dependent helicase [Candidatus Poriferisodalis sp.]|uniref:ATP-dependent helicase n=1 Tax=Candidatus Poriferisodalis sp. TaxID=3101277 RepID=UPI003B5C3441
MSATDDPILAPLNAGQRAAVTHGDGPALVVAGAGSGKTRVLSHRIAYLLAHRDLSPFGLLAITFTNKAAGEMRDRIGSLVGPVAHRMWISTFHSACARILRSHADALGYPSAFSIYDQADARRLTRYVVRDLDLDSKKFPDRTVHAAISTMKNRLVTPPQAADLALAPDGGGPFAREVARVYSEYQKRLRRAGAMDFDDLLMLGVELLATHHDVAEHYRQRFEHILVDEYQDTNLAQVRLIGLLAGPARNVFVVGDSDQSIYAFRGADITNILEFGATFDHASTYVLDQNYRSSQAILDAANSVIRNNLGRPSKNLWTDQSGGAKPIRYRGTNEEDEARYVCSELRRLRGEGQIDWSDAAVFYRSNAQSRVIEEELVANDVPYQIIGGTRFYDRREIKDALAFLRAAVNPSDEVSLKRVVNLPTRGIGDRSIAKLDDAAARGGVSLAEVIDRLESLDIRGTARNGLLKFRELMGRARARIPDGPAAVLEVALGESGYVQSLHDEGSIEADGRLEHLEELAGAAADFESCDEFLEQVSLVSDVDEMSDASQVSLMTLHSAKGLEFDIVFVTGMEDGVFPHHRSMTDPIELEEERRLAYVGITRARKQLYLTHSWNRMLHGQTSYNPPSRFLGEIPEQLLDDRSPDTGRYGSSWRPATSDWGANRGAGVRSGSATGPASEYSQLDEAEFAARGQRRADPARHDDSTAKGRESRREEARRRVAARLGEPKPAPSADLGYGVGDDVLHAKFGAGVVQDVRPDGDDWEVTVHFADGGPKTLVASFADLRSIRS